MSRIKKMIIRQNTPYYFSVASKSSENCCVQFRGRTLFDLFDLGNTTKDMQMGVIGKMVSGRSKGSLLTKYYDPFRLKTAYTHIFYIICEQLLSAISRMCFLSNQLRILRLFMYFSLPHRDQSSGCLLLKRNFDESLTSDVLAYLKIFQIDKYHAQYFPLTQSHITANLAL